MWDTMLGPISDLKVYCSYAATTPSIGRAQSTATGFSSDSLCSEGGGVDSRESTFETTGPPGLRPYLLKLREGSSQLGSPRLGRSSREVCSAARQDPSSATIARGADHEAFFLREAKAWSYSEQLQESIYSREAIEEAPLIEHPSDQRAPTEGTDDRSSASSSKPPHHSSSSQLEDSSAASGSRRVTQWAERRPPQDSLHFPVKHTFIHYDAPCSIRTSLSSPALLMGAPFILKRPCATERAHSLSNCRPCAYFILKEDGCRKGAECSFCHTCTVRDIRRRKKARAKALQRGEFTRRSPHPH
mmetsp:Transcript_29154/g.65793  ORF Transcript_29154/g.65793 Transcript_29154/m.65793 type:complete len:302 (-) Transcript_29154:61-966(-)